MAIRRVAHVLRKYDSLQWGGTETHVTAVTARLRCHGWDSEIHAPEGPTTEDAMIAPHVTLRRYQAFCPFVGPRAKREALFANAGNIASFDEIATLVRDASLSLAHVHTGRRIGGAVRTAMRLTGRPYVVSVHGPMLAEAEMVAKDTEQRLAGLLDVGQPLGWLLGARRVLEDAARVICFNDDERAALEARIGDRAIRMDHGVDPQRLGSGSRQRADERWPQLGRGPVVALLGRMAAQKNQLLAVKAFARGARRDARLVFAGAETDRGFRAEVERCSREAGIADRVIFLGNLDPHAEVPDLLARTDLLLVPSLHEAFGLVVLEGWAAGCPVLFARNSGLADIARAIRDDDCAIPSLEVEPWAQALRQAFERPERLAHWAADGRALVDRRFSWAAVTESLAHVYDEVLDEHADRRTVPMQNQLSGLRGVL